MEKIILDGYIMKKVIVIMLKFNWRLANILFYYIGRGWGYFR